MESREGAPEFPQIDHRARYRTAACALVVCWALGLGWWTRHGPDSPKMDAIAWVAAGTMLRDGRPAADIYATSSEQVVIAVEGAPGRPFGGPAELTLTRVLPGVALAAAARQLGYPDAHPPAFAYSPATALMGIPLSWFGWPRATIIMDVLGLLILGGVLAAIVARVRGATNAAFGWLALLLVYATLSHPLRFSLFLGQLTPVLAVGWLLLWLPENRGGRIAGGAVVGALGVLKVFPLLLMLWFAARRRWMEVIVSVAVFLCGILVLGFKVLAAWLDAARQIAAPIRVWTDNQSLAAALHRFAYPVGLARDWVTVQPQAALLVSATLGLAMLGCWCWRAVAAGGAEDQPASEHLGLFAALFILPMGLSALFWSHYIVLAFPALAVALVDARRGLARRIVAAIAGIAFCIDANAWTALMPAMERALGRELGAFLMRILIGLPAAGIVLLFADLILPLRQPLAGDRQGGLPDAS